MVRTRRRVEATAETRARSACSPTSSTARHLSCTSAAGWCWSAARSACGWSPRRARGAESPPGRAARALLAACRCVSRSFRRPTGSLICCWPCAVTRPASPPWPTRRSRAPGGGCGAGSPHRRARVWMPRWRWRGAGDRGVPGPAVRGVPGPAAHRGACMFGPGANAEPGQGLDHARHELRTHTRSAAAGGRPTPWIARRAPRPASRRFRLARLAAEQPAVRVCRQARLDP